MHLEIIVMKRERVHFGLQHCVAHRFKFLVGVRVSEGRIPVHEDSIQFVWVTNDGQCLLY